MNNLVTMSDLDNDEFDTIVELIIAIVFMGICIFATILTVYTLSKRVDYTPRVDKVQYTATYLDENNPFDFTGYQAYMLAWHMDGLSDTTVMWTAGPRYKETAITLEDATLARLAAVIDPVEHRAGFITYRNQIITGSRLGEGKSVAKILKDIVGDDTDELVKLYRGLEGYEKFELSLIDDHVTLNTATYDYSGTFYKEERLNKWTICHPTKCTH